jgi:hypothetical protein
MVGGAESFQVSDRKSIDTALSEAMSDRDLNNVMAQYFPDGLTTSNFLGSQVLPGLVSQSQYSLRRQSRKLQLLRLRS